MKEGMAVQPVAERALLVGAEMKGRRSPWSLESSVAELAQLARTADVEVVGQVLQRPEKLSSTHYVGKGKLEEITEIIADTGCNVVIFDDELSPRQQRNLEDALEIKVIDRTALILDIFASRAQTREGQLQVELAQHQYLLPRLIGQWSHLERLGAGIGTRGPGESQLETDRRLINKRISHLKSEIESVRKHRRLYRERRRKSAIPIIGIVGYTNSGKSTLLNALSDAEVLVEDKLFATLDPITRRLTLSDGASVLITDTVGFIQKLPHTLVTAFRATLEELEEASLLLHVVDITHENAAEQYQTVQDVLDELAIATTPTLTVINKLDLQMTKEEFLALDSPKSLVPHLGRQDNGVVMISAAQSWGLDRLREKIFQALFM